MTSSLLIDDQLPSAIVAGSTLLSVSAPLRDTPHRRWRDGQATVVFCDVPYRKRYSLRVAC